MGDIRAQLQEFGEGLKQDLQDANVGDEVKQKLGVKIDQKLDELGAKIGGQQDQTQAQNQTQGGTPEQPTPPQTV